MSNAIFLPLHNLLSVGRAADHPVCHDGKRMVRWAEFIHRLTRCQEHFAARAEKRWLLAADDTLDFALQLFGLLHAGKQVIIPPNTQPGTLRQMAATFDAVARGSLPAPDVDSLAGFSPLDPQTTKIDLYTSGSTGEAQRIGKTLAQFEAEIGVLESLWGSTLGMASIVATAPHQHIYGLLFRLLWPLSAGRAFDSVTCAHPDTLIERLATLQDVALISSPAQLSRLPELIPLAALQPTPRLVFSSGGPLPANTARIFYSAFGRAPTEVFGSTETGGIAWRRQEADDFWTVLPGVNITADDDGALTVRSPFLPDAEPWRMNDGVALLDDGRFCLRSRLDRIVKIEEKRLSLPDLEARLAEHPWISAAAALALPGRRQTLGAAVVLNPQGRAQLAEQGRLAATRELRRHLAAHFEAPLLPRRWRFIDHLPVNERGKLTQAALTALFTANADANAAG